MAIRYHPRFWADHVFVSLSLTFQPSSHDAAEFRTELGLEAGRARHHDARKRGDIRLPRAGRRRRDDHAHDLPAAAMPPFPAVISHVMNVLASSFFCFFPRGSLAARDSCVNRP